MFGILPDLRQWCLSMHNCQKRITENEHHPRVRKSFSRSKCQNYRYIDHNLRLTSYHLNSQLCRPWTTFTTPDGNPASRASSIRIMVAPGSRSEGFMMHVFPQTEANGNIWCDNDTPLSTMTTPLMSRSHINVTP